MPSFSPSRTRDIALRLSGLALLVLGALALSRLVHCVHAVPAHDCTPGEFALAALGLACLSPGALFTTLGAHIFDRVAISQRWAARSR
ncbi:hypothetical protein AB2M62_05355 [Sphingomonas sp. MMS12-HWE2-04]|uniref:hypothetical protein n=1 Tax=Sphingomonas sp. MMS12-HWE2-04 TaxID=3234199 RepID=UPI00384C2A48